MKPSRSHTSVAHLSWRAFWAPASLIDRLSRGLVIFTFLLLFSLLLIEILARTLFNEVLGWIIELAQYMLIAIVWLEAIVLTRMDAHIRVTFLIDMCSRFSPSSGKAFQLLARLGSLVFLATVALASGKLALGSFETLSPGMHIPFAYLYAIITLSSGLMCYFLLELLIRGKS